MGTCFAIPAYTGGWRGSMKCRRLLCGVVVLVGLRRMIRKRMTWVLRRKRVLEEVVALVVVVVVVGRESGRVGRVGALLVGRGSWGARRG